ncbi:MAG TPA: tRNA pseudouridine(38-40) synthase TruA [Paludibacteraceae bacterium]|nr:tRNA pseudouridine(38-40) synthase TruA [Paludibacteraceae bacterium]
MRYFIYFAYNGTNYHGWQIQPNAVSVQSTLTQAMETILRCTIALTGAGRTDTGVHAKKMTAHFDLETPISNPKQLVCQLNNLLPYDISVFRIEEVAPDAHARFDAISRTYKYYITTEKDPFYHELSAKISFPLDIEKMNEAASTLFEYTDFTSFSKLHTDAKTNNCKIMKAVWEKEGPFLIFTIQADRFLRNMVRAIVGTLIDIGRGKMTIEKFRQIIEKKDRCSAGSSAPAQGLFLVDVKYLH